MQRLFVSTLTAIISLAAIQSTQATVSFTGSYSQTFDTLANTGTPAWANDTTISGWSLFRQPGASPVAITTYATGTGSGTGGSFYSFGSAASTDRALGGLGSGGTYFGSPANGAVAGWITVGLANTSGGTFDNFTISYDGEEWRDGGAATPVAQTMVLEYGFGTSFSAVSAWTAAGSGFNFTSPVFANTSSGAAVDGNSAGKVTGLGGTISSLTWNNGDTLWVRWIENNDAGNDHGLAIDNFSISSIATPVPEPTTIALASLGGVACLLMMRRKR